MQKLLIILFFLFSINLAYSSSEYRIICQFEIEHNIDLKVFLSPSSNSPEGSMIKSLKIELDSEQFNFSSKDFKLATMKWNNPEKIYLGALIENTSHQINFIFVGPLDEEGSRALLDIPKDFGVLTPGRYEPIGSCKTL